MTKQEANSTIPPPSASTMSSEALSAPLRRRKGNAEPAEAAEGSNASEAIGQEPLQQDTLFNKHLYWWDQVPKQLQYNKYVRSGYRAGLSPIQCMCSILQYHNETGNIWVHLLPALLLGTAVIRGSLVPWPLARVAFWEAVLPILVCLCGSVLYHTLMANHWHYQKYLFVDVCGVFLVLIMGASSGMYWGLQCYPWLCGAFIASYTLAAAMCVIMGLKAKTQLGRAAPMVGLLLVRGGAVVARMLLRTGSQSAALRYAAMELTAVAGAVVNVSRIPEKWLFPKEGPDGKCRKARIFDCWLNSHQLMHLLVLCSLAFKYMGMAADYRYRKELKMGC